MRSRVARLVGIVVVALSGVAIVGASPAAAATGKKLPINTTCLGFFINNDGSMGAVVPPEQQFPLPITVAAVGGPTEVKAGSTFTGTAGSVQVPIPAQVDTKVKDGTIGIDGSGIVNVYAAANITETIKVVGAASIGTPTISGGNVQGATVTKVGADKVRVVYPGTKTTDAENFRDLTSPGQTGVISGDEHQFSPGASFSSPTLSIPVTAGNAGTKIKFVMTGSPLPSKAGQPIPEFGDFKVDSDVDPFGTGGHVPVRAFCDPKEIVIGQVQVVQPPPPGAPNAVADVSQTDQGKAATVDVLGNDTPGSIQGQELAMDVDNLAVTKAPAHGNTSVTDDHQITYTPASDFVGTDEFTYKLCSIPPETTTTTIPVPKAAVQPCDTAVVTVTVLEAQETVQAPPPTTAAPATTVAAAAELPRTGSSSAPLGLLGGALFVAGLGALGLARSRKRASA
jgi:LPXTG-motif cell wall-anchored protein